MASANDNEKKRRVRDGYLAQWDEADFSEIASDEVLVRLAEARNSSSASANKFMLFAAAAAFLYLLKLEGIASGLSVGDYSLRDLPFGLFLLAVIGTSLATLSLIRTGDSRAYDRQLRLACELRYEADCDARYFVFPNEKAWGEPFSRMATVIESGLPMSAIRTTSLTLISLFLLLLIVAPIISAADYLISGRYLINKDYQSLRYWCVLFLTVAHTLTLVLSLWTRFSDQD